MKREGGRERIVAYSLMSSRKSAERSLTTILKASIVSARAQIWVRR